MCETYGRDNHKLIAEQFPNKTVEEVKEYSQEFWKKWHLIENGQKYVERIEKGEQEIEKMKQIDDAINEKFLHVIKQFKKENPEKDLKELPLESVNIYRIDRKNF